MESGNPSWKLSLQLKPITLAYFFALLTGQLLQVPALYWRDARHAQLPQYIAINVLENMPFIVLVME